MIREAIADIVAGRCLDESGASSVMSEIMGGEATPAQIAALVVALRLRGETVDELVGFARAMRSHAVRIDPGAELDTCGTGGDGSGSFNISTAAAFVAAGAGVRVAKHGNRAMSSSCGSADVLEALGVRIDLDPSAVEQCIRETGIGFMFAPKFHPAMKHAAAPRREIGVRTVFNVLGPLCNPAGATAQLMGVADPALVEKMAEVLVRLGVRRAMVVHGADGLDEFTLAGPTTVCEIAGGRVDRYTVEPGDVGLPGAPAEELAGGSAQDNADVLKSVLCGARGAQRDVVVLNAGAALAVAGAADGLVEGMRLAERAIDSGGARRRLDAMVAFCREHEQVAA
jgi:anthranilate phosphoribosyltransferase